MTWIWTLLVFVAGYMIPDPWTCLRLWRKRALYWVTFRRASGIGSALGRWLLLNSFALDRFGQALLAQVQVWTWPRLVGLTIRRQHQRGKAPVVYLNLKQRK